jgi:hypothetical protein
MLWSPQRDAQPREFPELVSVTAKRLEEKFVKLGQRGCRGIDALVYIDLWKPVTRYLHPATFTETDGAKTMHAHGYAVGQPIWDLLSRVYAPAC